MFKEANLSVQDLQEGARYRNGKPWVLVLRPRTNMSSAWITLHEDAWSLILTVLRFALSVDGAASSNIQQDPRANPHPYYEAALVALRRWFMNDGAGDPALFLIYLENNIKAAAGRLNGRVRDNWYLWRAYSPDRHGPLNLDIYRLETNDATEPNAAADQTSAEFFISEAHVAWYRFGYRVSREDMTDDECGLVIRLERRNLLGAAVTSMAELTTLTAKMYAAANQELPDWMKPQLPPCLPPSSPVSSRGSPIPSPGRLARDRVTKWPAKPHRCEFCRSSFSTDAKKATHIQVFHRDRLVALTGQAASTDQTSDDHK